MKTFLYVLFTLHVIFDIVCCTLITNIDTGTVQPSESPDVENLSTVGVDSKLLHENHTPNIDNILEPSSELNVESKSTDIPQTKIGEATNVSITNRTLNNDTLVTNESEKPSEASVIIVSEGVPQNIIVSSETVQLRGENGTEGEKKESDQIEMEKENITGEKSEEMPSFSEWAQKRLEEVEKHEQNTSVKGHATNGKEKVAKQRWNNYASLDCGAKVVAANPESTKAGSILSATSDEYKLNPCTSRIWFVVELCEAIQPKRIELANYELYSSSPKDFVVSVSERFPTRDWKILGKFTAKDERDVQSFDIDSDIFGKYIKVEIKSHYRSEHYCPISLFRAYGTSVFEVLQKEDPAHENRIEEDDDDNEDDDLALYDESGKNLFSSAKDAVVSIVRKAAEVLGNKVNNKTILYGSNITSDPLWHNCKSLRYSYVCASSNEALCDKIFWLLSCHSEVIRNLVAIPRIYKSLWNSDICEMFGFEFIDEPKTLSYANNVAAFFTLDYLGAMCNEVSIVGGQASLNVTQQFLNITNKLTTDKIVHINVKEKNILEETLTDKSVEIVSNGSIVLEEKRDLGDAENESNSLQIKPTKVLSDDSKVSHQTVDLINDAELPPPVDPVSTETLPHHPPTEPGVITSSTVDFSPEVSVAASEVNDIHSADASEGLDDHIDHIISDLNGDRHQNITASATTIPNQPPQGPKESIFLRLSNRIKALERNMSLSSQYLEELSRRYKKQFEDIQHLLEKTIVALREENNQRNKQLEERLDNLTATIETLTYEGQFLRSTLYSCVFLVALGGGMYFFCRKPTQNVKRTFEKTSEILRRKSVDDLTCKPKEKKKRRPSDQVMKIVRHSTVNNEEKIRRPKKRRKNPIIARSNSACSFKSEKYCDKPLDWVEEAKKLQADIPWMLEESDNLTLEIGTLPNDVFDSSVGPSPRAQSEVREVKDTPVEYKRSNSDSPPTASYKELKREKKGFRKLLKKVF